MNYTWETDYNKDSEYYVDFIKETNSKNENVLFGVLFSLYLGYILLI